MTSDGVNSVINQLTFFLGGGGAGKSYPACTAFGAKTNLGSDLTQVELTCCVWTKRKRFWLGHDKCFSYPTFELTGLELIQLEIYIYTTFVLHLYQSHIHIILLQGHVFVFLSFSIPWEWVAIKLIPVKILYSSVINHTEVDTNMYQNIHKWC